MDLSDSIAELVVTPSCGTYDYETKIWSIDKLEMGSRENVSVSFTAKKDAIIRFDCGSESTSASFRVLGTPVIGTLQSPEPVCDGANLCAQVPEIQEGAGVTGVIWHLDDILIDLGAVLFKENNGSLLQCEVVNKCGSTMSNKVQVEVIGAPEIGMIDENIYSVCEGEALNISVPTIETNGNADVRGRWVLNGETYTEGTPIYKTSEPYYELSYEVEGECGGVIKSPWVCSFVVLESIVLGELETPEPICNETYFAPIAPNISFKGTEYVSDRWVLDGEEYDYDIISYDKNGKKLHYEIIQSCNGKESVVKSNEVEITVLPPVEISDIPEVYEYKKGNALELINPTIEYAVEPNEYIKYNSKWTLLDENEYVVLEDYMGQPIYDNEVIKQVRYEVNPVIYLSPEIYYQCERVYSNVAKLIQEEATAIEVVMADDEETKEIESLVNVNTTNESVQKGRNELCKIMTSEANKLVPEYGITLIDIVPRQIKYSDELTESVYNRMIKERNQIAQAYRSRGEGKKAEWMGKLENEKRKIESEAYKTAEEIKGSADAEAARIYANAYNKDPEFYNFWKSMESYKKTLKEYDATYSTNMDYFKYLYSAQGN